MQPIVFIHGIRVSATMWDPVIAHLDRPAKAIDLPGHGTRAGEPFSMDAATSAVAEAIDSLGGSAVVVGLSLGGYVGIATAERFPGKVAGLVAMGCTSSSQAMLGVYRFVARLAARNPSRANRISEYGFRHLLPGPTGAAIVAGGLWCEAMPQVVDAVAEHDQLAALAAYPGRVWLVNGTRDPFRADERAFLRACRDGRLILIPGRGHLGVLAAPGPLARLIDDLCSCFQVERPASAVATPRPR
ncbi:alpha/beta fold hydrolase [Streptosporangium saharense]|uniref:Pimeloyl-ACP methyl ester carboxylesterase n=1 Tax=Streptosporangium saharense TaxID=1706840 RepID=A0A7W7QIX0_9ACTN|nr:alpha/beta hydrolase [Streptosporangium saharense]MBB4914435.1 pimeloyl-ACP methyl ester carboxylesterase [Streptosporangium saharense]